MMRRAARRRAGRARRTRPGRLRLLRARLRRTRRKLGERLRYARYATPARRRILIIVGGLLVLGAAWIMITGYLAEKQARQVADQVAEVRALVASGQPAQARTAAARIPAMTDRLQRLSSGPAWWTAAHVPYLGRPLEALRDTSAAAGELGSRTVPLLLREVDALDPAKLRVNGDTIKLSALNQARPGLDQAVASLRRATAYVNDAPADTWLSGVDVRRAQISTELTALTGYVDAAQRATAVLPVLLGGHGTQHIFVALQNEAELRGTGGLPGAFAIATATNGTVRFTEFHSDATLLGYRPTGLKFGAQYDALYGASTPTASFADSNASPNFPYAAQIWAQMWQQKTGQRIDAAVAVDPTALSYFLQATGPVVAQRYLITASNVVSVTQKDEYAAFPDNAKRRAFLVAVLKATSTTLTSGAGAPLLLAQAATRAASGHRLLVWSRDPAVQRVLEKSNYAGVLPGGSHPLAGLVVNNAAAGKLDYYLKRGVVYNRTGCGSTRDVSVTITLANTAPASGLPAYVTDRLDDPPKSAKPGDNHSIVDYYATRGAQVTGLEINGKPATTATYQALGHEVLRFDLQLPRGTKTTIVLHLSEPAGKGAPIVWKQPGVTALSADVFDQSC